MGLLGWLSNRFSRAPDSRRTGLYLHRFFTKEIERHVDPWPLVANLIVERLEAQGVRVSRRDRQRIEERARSGRLEGFKLRSWKWWESRSLTVTLTEEDGQAIADRVQRVIDKVPAIVPEAVASATPAFLTSIREGYRSDMRKDEREFRRLEQEIAVAWREPFESLSLLIELAYRIGFTVDEYCQQKPPEEPQLVEVLCRLHLRGIHVAREVLTLLRCGYADAAMARWRTLHEIAVVACFVSEHGGACAKRYLDHDAIESFKAAREYQESAERLGFPQLPEEELAAIRAQRDRAVAEHGEAFDVDYGWAASLLGKRRPTFADVERAVGLDHLRPFYRLASHNVHASPKGVLFKLGTLQEGMLLVGPSPYGLADPGQNTALSLAVLVAHLARICPVMDVLVVARVAQLLTEEIAARFAAVQDSLEAAGRNGGG